MTGVSVPGTPRYPILRLVDAPTLDARIRFDFHDRFAAQLHKTWVDSVAFTLGSPVLLGDAGAVGVGYGPRNPSFTAVLEGPKFRALELLSALSREVLRAESWLMFQLDEGTFPVWARLYRTQPEDLSFDQVVVDDRDPNRPDKWRIGLLMTADPFLYGQRVVLPQVTVGNSDDDTNFLRVELPEIVGDTYADLRVTVEMTNDTYEAGVGSAWLLAVCSGDGPQPLLSPIGPPADEWGVVSGTAAEATSSDYLNDYYLQLDLAAGDAEIQGLLTDVARGRYKILAHATGIPDATEVTFTFGQWVAAGVVWSEPVVRIVDGQEYGGRSWVDLGTHSFPFGQRLPPDVTTPVFDVDIRLALSGTSTIRLDELILIPVDGDGTDTATILSSTLTYWGAGGDRTATWDGDAAAGGAVWVVNGSGQLLDSTVQDRGGYPKADPASDVNELWVFPTNAGLAAASAVTSRNAEWTVDVSYHPQHLYLGGA